MEWKVVNAVSRDVEREHLNKILKDIRAEVDRIESLKTGANTDVRDIVGTMVEGNTEHGMEVLYDAVKKVLNFAITGYLIKIKGDVVGQAEVTGTGTVVINTELAEEFETIPEPTDNGRVYWRKTGEWEAVPTVVRNFNNIVGDGLVAAFFDPVLQIIDVATRQIEVAAGELTVTNADAVAGNPLLGLADVADSNTGTLQGITVDAKGRVTGTTDGTITGTADQIDVANGDAAAGPPTISLADLTDTGVGTFKLLTRDSKGRLSGTQDGDTDDVPEGVTNLYFTNARADARIDLQKGQPNGLAPLDSGAKLDGAFLPDLAITDTFVVASEAAMLALTAERGDVAVRTDLNQSFILTAEPASALANWQELLTPTSPVTSVFGRVGAVVAQTGDYTFAQIGSKPTTLGGYGITDAAPLSHVGSTGAAHGDATTSVAGFMSAADKAKLDTVSIGANYYDDALAQAALAKPGYIDGLSLSWNSGTSITAGSGAATIPSTNHVLEVVSPITAAGLSLSASTWYHVYLYDSSGPAIEVATAMPVVYSGTAAYKTGDSSRRYIGSVLTNGSGNIYNFRHCGNWMFWQENIGASPFRVLSNGTATTRTTVSCSGAVPVTAQAAQVRMINLSTNSAVLFLSNANAAANNIQVQSGTPSGSSTAEKDIVMPLSTAQGLDYMFPIATSGGGGYLDISGYIFGR